jgi:hypothetical protein
VQDRQSLSPSATRGKPTKIPAFGAGHDLIRSKPQLSSLSYIESEARAKAPEGPKNKVRFVTAYPNSVDAAASVDAIADASDTDAADADAAYADADADVATPAAVDILADADANAADAVDAVDAIAVDVTDDMMPLMPLLLLVQLIH